MHLKAQNIETQGKLFPINFQLKGKYAQKEVMRVQ